MGPAITLAALTSFIAGLCMLPANVVAYYKFGVFMMIIMACSWFFSTYFFLTLCGAFGPEKFYGNLCHFFKCSKKSKHKSKRPGSVIYLKGVKQSDTVVELNEDC